MDDEQFNDQALASAVRYLFQTGQKDAANLLLSCRIQTLEFDQVDYSNEVVEICRVLLRGSPVFYKEYIEYDKVPHSKTPRDNLKALVREAFEAVLPPVNYVEIDARAELINVDTDWRTQLLAEEETGQITNQNPYRKEPIIWQGMKFDGEGEVKIAQELDRVGVMFFPTCLARVGPPNNRQRRIPDFLICYKGKWGVLEIDGKKYHTPENATADHDRRRLIEQHGGIAWFDRYAYSRCMNEPQEVVKEFLSILANK
jgi:hypothetical protein